MRGIIVDEVVKVYAEPNSQNLSLTTLRKGDEFDLGKVTRKNKEVWVQITLPSGQRGFIPGETHYFEKQKILLLTDQIELREEANPESDVLKTYPKSTILTAIGIVKDENKGWVKVTDDDGVIGYIKGETRIGSYTEPTKPGGKKMMITGGIFTLLAIGFYFYSNSLITPTDTTTNTTTNTTSIMSLAVITFGLLQFIQGLAIYLKAQKNEKDKKRN